MAEKPGVGAGIPRHAVVQTDPIDQPLLAVRLGPVDQPNLHGAGVGGAANSMEVKAEVADNVAEIRRD